MDKCCSKCGEVKALSEFHRQRNRPDGHRAWCKLCSCAYSREYSGSHYTPDTGLLSLVCRHCDAAFTYVKTTGRRRFYCSDQCRQNAGEAQKLSRAIVSSRSCECGSLDVARVGKPVCAGCRKDQRGTEKLQLRERRRTLRTYGLTPEGFDQLLASQQGRCAICRDAEPGANRGWNIDHDHGCCAGKGSCGGCVRGLLCQNCNLLLGHALDSTARLDQAKAYLLKHSQWSLPMERGKIA